MINLETFKNMSEDESITLALLYKEKILTQLFKKYQEEVLMTVYQYSFHLYNFNIYIYSEMVIIDGRKYFNFIRDYEYDDGHVERFIVRIPTTLLYDHGAWSVAKRNNEGIHRQLITEDEYKRMKK